jgi:hypothetical protein
MALFDEVFNRLSISDMLFFNVKAVLIHPTLDDLKEKNPKMFERWKYLSKSKYDCEIFNGNVFGDGEVEIYEEKAIYYPEFTRIVAITYAFIQLEKSVPKRYFKKIVSEDEYVVIANFMDVLHQLSSEAVQSTPPSFPMLCGHNIINYDIPLLFKRYVLYKDKFLAEEQLLPLILKRTLNAKPWESCVIDTVSVWKFNGNDYTPLMLIADHLGLKKTVDLETLSDVSRQYWKTVMDNPEKALDEVALQSATQTNLVIQLINELRVM